MARSRPSYRDLSAYRACSRSALRLFRRVVIMPARRPRGRTKCRPGAYTRGLGPRARIQPAAHLAQRPGRPPRTSRRPLRGQRMTSGPVPGERKSSGRTGPPGIKLLVSGSGYALRVLRALPQRQGLRSVGHRPRLAGPGGHSPHTAGSVAGHQGRRTSEADIALRKSRSGHEPAGGRGGTTGVDNSRGDVAEAVIFAGPPGRPVVAAYRAATTGLPAGSDFPCRCRFPPGPAAGHHG
jgi:hypothetical protein